jgi:glycosyltransferase involved in cell wall biosynthesis
MISKFDFLLISHAKPNVGTFNSFFSYAHAINRCSKYKVALIYPSLKNSLEIKFEKINKNLYFISLPSFNYHKYFNLQLIRLFCLIYILITFKYKSILASGFSQPQIAIPVTLIKIFKKKNVIYLWDDMWGDGLGLKINSIVNKIFLICEKLSLNYCDHVIYPSSFFKSKINQHKKPFTKIYQPYIPIKKRGKKSINNSENLKKKLGIQQNQKIIVCMGNAFFETENIILKTLNKLKKEKNFTCIFIGKFEISKKNKAKFKLLVKDNIINLGFVKNRKYFDNVMELADVYILPMARNIIEKSRFPVRILDYLNRKKVIISNATGELKYLFKKYNFGILTKFSSESFSKGIKKGLELTQNKKKYYYQQQNLAINNEFNYKITSSKLINLLNN